VNRVVRSTRVPIAGLSSPTIRSLPSGRVHPIVGLGGALADHHLWADELLAPPVDARPGTRSARPVRRQAAGVLR
jgi:hypothetical protein